MNLRQYRYRFVSKKKISVWLLMVLLTLPHLNPPYLEEIPIVETLLNIWRAASFVVIAMRQILVKQKVSAIAALLCIQQTFLFLMTLLNGRSVYASAALTFSLLSVTLLYEWKQHDRDVFLSSQLFCFELAIYINLLTELLYPNGLYGSTGRLWFLGYYNNHTKYFIPALMFAWLYKEATGKKLRTYLLTAAIFVSALLVWSGGVLVALFGMALAYIVLKNHTSLFHYYTYWSIHLFFFIFVVVLRLPNSLRWLIDGVLGKWHSLLSRMNLWDRVWELISDAPLFGHGISDAAIRRIENGVSWGTHAHNLILEILYQGGLVNLVFWTAIVILSGKKVYRYRDTMESKIIALAFLGWCLANLVEPFTTPFLMGMFIIACHSNVSYRSIPRSGEAGFKMGTPIFDKKKIVRNI